MKQLSDAVESCVRQSGIQLEGSTLLCALSGGADSVALLHALCSLREHIPFSLHAVHVQHNLRGDESQGDEQFVRLLCHELQVPLAVLDAGLSGSMQDAGMETLARESRRRIFADQIRVLNADALLTAHHRDDQAETVLMHLLRGSGLQGLCGMPVCSSFAGRKLLRPFLGFSKQQLLEALGPLPYREDSSNFSALTARNALRLTMLPQLEEWFPGASVHLAQTAECLTADEVFLQQSALELMQSSAEIRPPLFALLLKPVQAAPEALRRRVLRAWFAQGASLAEAALTERSLSHEDTLRLCSLFDAPEGTRLNLPGNLQALRTAGRIHLLKQSGEALNCSLPGEQPVHPETLRYHFPLCTICRQCPDGSIPQNAERIVLTPTMVQNGLFFRTIRPGDTIHPFGAFGSKELRRYLTDRKIPRHLRPHLPMLFAGSEALWIPGLCVSEKLRLNGIQHGSIELILTGDLPPHQSKE